MQNQICVFSEFIFPKNGEFLMELVKTEKNKSKLKYLVKNLLNEFAQNNTYLREKQVFSEVFCV